MNHLPENPEEAEPQAPDQGFLQRWSQRKAADIEPELADDGAANAGDPEPADSAIALNEPGGDNAEVADAELPVLTDEDMPSLDTLDADSDYAPFMSEGVSSELRQLALKKLFFSGLFGSRDGLDDYDDDFTRFEPLGDTITSDMKFHMRRKEKERLAKEEAEREAEEQAAITEASEPAESAAEAPEETAETEMDEAASDASDEPEEPPHDATTTNDPALAEDSLANQKPDEQTGNNS